MKVLLKYIIGVTVIFLLFPILIGENYSVSLLGAAILMGLGVPIADYLFQDKK